MDEFEKLQRLLVESSSKKYLRLLQAVLASPVASQNNPEINTVQGYIVALGCAAAIDGQDFSPKRPFGDSSWEGELTDAVEAGVERAMRTLGIPTPPPATDKVIVDASRLLADTEFHYQMQMATLELASFVCTEPDDNRVKALAAVIAKMLNALFPERDWND